MFRDLAYCINDIIQPVCGEALNLLNAKLVTEERIAEPLSEALVVDCYALHCPFNTPYGKTRVVDGKVYMTQICSHPVLAKFYSKE